MRLLVELSLEHPTLPAAELPGAVRALGGEAGPLDRDVGVCVVDVGGVTPEALAERLALTHALHRHVTSVPAGMAALVEAASEVDVADRSFAVRARRIASHHPHLVTTKVEREVGQALARAGGRVNLTTPEVEVRVLIAERAYVGVTVATVDRAAYEARHVRHRPHVSPIAIHPRHARALLNLARVQPGERVLDPFCGTGGIALEAGLVGAEVWASDLDPRMAAGTEALLEQVGVRGRVEVRDVGEAPEFVPDVDVICTDPPYGRASTTMREGTEKLYARFLDAAHAALRPGGRLAVVFPAQDAVRKAATRFVLEQEHEMRVHRSLSRFFAVFRKA